MARLAVLGSPRHFAYEPPASKAVQLRKATPSKALSPAWQEYLPHHPARALLAPGSDLDPVFTESNIPTWR